MLKGSDTFLARVGVGAASEPGSAVQAFLYYNINIIKLLGHFERQPQ